MTIDDKSRLYRIILLDRTTNPKVNRYLRDLLDCSVWQASTLMNVTPSVLLENVPLNEAIDVKTHLGRFGLRTKIEAVEEDKDQKVAVILPEERPEVLSDIPAPPEIPPLTEEQAPSTEALEPPVLEPQPPGRLSQRKRKRIPLLMILLPFLGILFIAIIINILGSEFSRKLFERRGRIVIYQDTSAVKKMEFEESDQSLLKKLIARMKQPQEIGLSPPPMEISEGEASPTGTPEGTSPETVAPESPVSGEVTVPPSTPEGGESPSLSPTESNISPTPTGLGAGTSPGYSSPATSPLSGSKGAVPPLSQAKMPPPSGQIFLSPSTGLLSPPGAGKSPASAKASAKGKAPKTPRPPYEFLGSPEGEGINSEKLNAIVKDAEKALAQKDSNAVKQDCQRLDLAETLAEPQQRDLQNRLASPTLKNLRDRMQKIADAEDLKPGLQFHPELTGAEIQINTNLPDSALVEAKLSLPGRKNPLEYTLPVENGTLELPYAGGLPSGNIALKLELAPLEEQPPSVLEVIGESGENLKGENVKEGGKIEFQDKLNNKIARSRGEVTNESAEPDFKRIALSQGLNDFSVSDFDNQNLPTNSYITIAANNVVEAEFIAKACRSAGYLTIEMNDPPQFLRLIVNKHQYFIPTDICRKILREYGEDDPVALDYLLNYLLAL